MEQSFYSRYNTGSANDGQSPALPYPVKPIRRPAVFLEVYPQVLGVSTLKRCSKCGELKPREAFGRHKATRDGLQYECNACRREYRAANAKRIAEYNRAYAATNRERITKYQREYYAANAERARAYSRAYSAANAERRRKYRAANAEQKAEYNLAYNAANVERIREHGRAYRQTDAGKAAMRAGSHNRRARKMAAGGTYTAADLAAIRAAQTDAKGRLICWACNKPIKGTPHLDHWIPLAKGGTNSPGNLHYMHAKCNRTKSAKLPTELGRLL